MIESVRVRTSMPSATCASESGRILPRTQPPTPSRRTPMTPLKLAACAAWVLLVPGAVAAKEAASLDIQEWNKPDGSRGFTLSADQVKAGKVYPFTSPTTQATSLIQNSFSGWRQKLSKRFV